MERAMNGIESVELIFGAEIVPVFVENNAYMGMMDDVRKKYKEQGIDFPIVNLRDDLRLATKQYQVLINKEIVFDGVIGEIGDKTMCEEQMIRKVSDSFYDYYNRHFEKE